MSANAHGHGQDHPRMSRLQWEQHLEEELAAREYRIAAYEAKNLRKALALSRQQGPTRGTQPDGRRQAGPVQPQMQPPEAPRTVPHGLPVKRPSESLAAPNIAEGVVANHIDLTSVSDGEDSKSARVDTPTPQTVLIEPRATLPRTATPLVDLPIVQEQIRSSLGMLFDNQLATSEVPPVVVQPHHEAQVKTEKQTRTFEPPFKEFPTIVSDPDSEAYVELRCQVCGGNASYQHNLHGQLKHFTGAAGVRSHFRICHPSKIEKGEILTLVDMVRRSTHRKLTVMEVKDMLAKKAGTYAVGNFRAAPSEPNARIRGPREQKPQKKQCGLSAKGQTKKRSRSYGASSNASRKNQPDKNRLRWVENGFFNDKTVSRVDEDDEDDELPIKKYAHLG